MLIIRTVVEGHVGKRRHPLTLRLCEIVAIAIDVAVVKALQLFEEAEEIVTRRL